MSRCTLCRTFTINVELHCLQFHPNLASLKKSAKEGCDFCLLCWTGFQQDWKASQTESVLKGEAPQGVSKFDPSIWIYIHFRDYSPQRTQPQISVYCGRVSPLLGEKESSFGLNHINLAVYGKEGTEAGLRTPGRICTTDHGPDVYIALIRQFLQGCRKSHRACDFQRTYEMPTRVIDVGNPNQGEPPRLVVTGPNMEEKYLALSYCWGPATDAYTLNAQTMKDILSGMDESWLVAAHRDTLALARSLGILWRSPDARNSFIVNEYKQPAPYCEIPLDDGQFGNVLVGLRRSSDYSVTETRGWCLQEKRLSRRMVFFGKEQLYFLCQSCSYSEDRNYEEEKPSSLHAIISVADVDLSSRRDRLLQFWDGVVVDFSKRQLSNPHDIFAATASIAAPISNAIESRYLAGLWECDLLFRTSTRPLPTRFAPSPVIRAPSWSWAAIQGGVYPLSGNSFRKMMKKCHSGDFIKVKPKLRNPDRWTSDTHCGVDVLHCHLASCSFWDAFKKPWPGPALGAFDFAEEGVEEVRCLQVTAEDGMLLHVGADGKFRRAGLFQLYKMGWFDDVEENEVRLV
ncbi:hypothetical protein FDECE_1652 [Fusarium decemcellulare]|nr:hypothetical protein FDECE_1652 [Fusarium decemcellulare]